MSPLAVVTFDDGYRNNLELGAPVLSSMGIPATVFVVTRDVGKQALTWSEAGETNPADLLTWDEIRQLQKSGWEIGSHCSEHIHLARRSAEEQKSLLNTSLDDLHTHLGAGAYSLAYPFGSFNSDTIAIMRDSGFFCAVTTESGINRSIRSVYELARVPMKGYRFDHYWRSKSWLKEAFSS